jgi:hypothetical protein
MSSAFVNYRQPPIERQAKYSEALRGGFSVNEARRMRDWRWQFVYGAIEGKKLNDKWLQEFVAA